MRPVRTLHVEWNDDGTVGGSHQALYDLVTGMDRDRYEPVALFQQDNPFIPRLREAGVETHDYSAVRLQELALRRSSGLARRRLDMVQAIGRRLNFLREHRIGIVHLNNSPFHGGADWMPAAKLHRIPVLSSAMSFGEKAARRPWGVLFRRYDRILPVSEVIARRWQDLGVQPERLTVVHHGVDMARIEGRVSRDAADVRSELGVPDDELLVLMAGNIRRWKGQHVVLQALAEMSESARDRLVVVFAGAPAVGDGGYESELDALIENHGLERNVRMIGFRNDLPDLLAAADIVVHSSVEVEPGGIVVMEAMALGRAVIASNEGGHTEVMVPGTGITFDTRRPAELAGHLEALGNDPELRLRLGRAARDRVAEFSVERNVEETLAVYDELLGR